MAENEKTGTIGQTSDPVSKPHSMEEIVPSSVPLIIPYLEIYRTNELEYVEYQSPFLNQNSEESGSEEDVEDDETTSEEEKTRKQKLWTNLANILNTYYPKLKNKDNYITELINDEVTWSSVAHTVNKMGNPNSRNQNYVIELILQQKELYSRTTRRNYAQSKKMLDVTGKLLNTKKGQTIITALSNSKIQLGQGKETNDIVLNKLGKTLKTISEKHK